MTTTTTQCSKCHDRGVIWTEIFPGVWKNHLCDCHPVEYWAAESDRKMAELRQRIQAMLENGGEKVGEIQNAG